MQMCSRIAASSGTDLEVSQLATQQKYTICVTYRFTIRPLQYIEPDRIVRIGARSTTVVCGITLGQVHTTLLSVVWNSGGRGDVVHLNFIGVPILFV